MTEEENRKLAHQSVGWKRNALGWMMNGGKNDDAHEDGGGGGDDDADDILL